METYALYLSDDRYSIPTLVLATVATESRARAKATELFLESPHHLSVDVSRGGITLFTVDEKRSFSEDDAQRARAPSI